MQSNINAKKPPLMCFLAGLLLGLCSAACTATELPARIDVANFASTSEQQVFTNWQPYHFSLFGRSTRYQLVQQGNKQVMLAFSEKAASGLIRNLSVKLDEHPILNWHWKITGLPAGADDHSKAGDDHSARLYVIFKAPEANVLGWLKSTTGLSDSHALNYVWANQTASDTLIPSPYTERSVMLTANSGVSQLGQWVGVSRNVYQDYRRAFGSEPPPVSAIAIMTDGDNTGSNLTSYYGDIYFSRSDY